LGDSRVVRVFSHENHFRNDQRIQQSSSIGEIRNVVVLQGQTFVGGALLATTLLALEGAIWATAYRVLGALTDNKAAMLYSLNAMTSYGHTDLHLAPHWEMLGALEALHGWILFGLTTAFLFYRGAESLVAG
jgi:hypothetical protein